MSSFEKRIADLEKENKQLTEYIEFLKEDIDELKKSKGILKKFLKEDKVQLSGFIRQGLKMRNENEFYGWHYVVFPIAGIPATLNILDVKDLVQESLISERVASKYIDYTIESIDYSQRSNSWQVQIGKMINLLKNK